MFLCAMAPIGHSKPISKLRTLKAQHRRRARSVTSSVPVRQFLAIRLWLGPEDSNAMGVNGDQANNGAMDSGAAYVFVRSGTNWSQQAYLKASNTGARDFFGYAVAIDSDTIVVAAPLEGSAAKGVNGNQSDNSAPDSGAAYVFTRSGTAWTQQAYLK